MSFTTDERKFQFEFEGLTVQGRWNPFLIYNGDRARFMVENREFCLDWCWGRDGWRFDTGPVNGLPPSISNELTNFGYAGRVYNYLPNEHLWPCPTRKFYVAAVKAALDSLSPEEQQSRAGIIAAGRLGPDGNKDKDLLYLRTVIPFWKQQRDGTFQQSKSLGPGAIGINFHRGEDELNLFLEEFREVSGREWSDGDALSLQELLEEIQWPNQE